MKKAIMIQVDNLSQYEIHELVTAIAKRTKGYDYHVWYNEELQEIELAGGIWSGLGAIMDWLEGELGIRFKATVTYL